MIFSRVEGKILKNTVNTFTLQPSKEPAQLFSVSQLRVTEVKPFVSVQVASE